MTRAEWLRGEIPVVPYPADAVGLVKSKLDFSYPTRVGLRVGIFPKAGSKVRARDLRDRAPERLRPGAPTLAGHVLGACRRPGPAGRAARRNRRLLFGAAGNRGDLAARSGGDDPGLAARPHRHTRGPRAHAPDPGRAGVTARARARRRPARARRRGAARHGRWVSISRFAPDASKAATASSADRCPRRRARPSRAARVGEGRLAEEEVGVARELRERARSAPSRRSRRACASPSVTRSPYVLDRVVRDRTAVTSSPPRS